LKIKILLVSLGSEYRERVGVRVRGKLVCELLKIKGSEYRERVGVRGKIVCELLKMNYYW
jgi:hypothetical protein